MTDQADLIRRTSFFANLQPDAAAALARQCVWRSIKRGEVLIGQDDRSNDVVVLLSGLARVNIYSHAGKQVSFRDIGPGEMFGELSAIDQRPRSAGVECLEPGQAVIIPRAVFLDLVRRCPDVAEAVMIHLTRMVRAMTERVFQFSTMAVRNRVHAELLRLADAVAPAGNSCELSPSPTHQEIASRISTHREAVTRELNRLEDLGVLEKHGRALTITDLARLRAMLDDPGD